MNFLQVSFIYMYFISVITVFSLINVSECLENDPKFQFLNFTPFSTLNDQNQQGPVNLVQDQLSVLSPGGNPTERSQLRLNSETGAPISPDFMQRYWNITGKSTRTFSNGQNKQGPVNLVQGQISVLPPGGYPEGGSQPRLDSETGAPISPDFMQRYWSLYNAYLSKNSKKST
ncbi:uncharacterized protein LOC128390021 [Panonychus citri]|uniref:uncharacterized protein LOC128390021 n=1 Tax=Panonychus citri TaxID=50023 RepID=UPI002307CEEF|nr:uncharacterized protein LOC128390021 [Panonychus citri]